MMGQKWFDAAPLRSASSSRGPFGVEMAMLGRMIAVRALLTRRYTVHPNLDPFVIAALIGQELFI